MIGKQPVPLGGGVNVFDDPVALPDGQWQRLRNLATRQTGILGQRPSLSFVREVIPHWKYWDTRLYTTSAGQPFTVPKYHSWGLYIRPIKFIFDPNYGEITMVVVTVAALTVLDRLTGDTVVSVPSGTFLLICLPGHMQGSGSDPVLSVGVLGQRTNNPSLFTFNGSTFCFPGGSNGAHLITPTPVVGLTDPVSYEVNDFGSDNTSFNPDGACVVRDRVVYFKGSHLYWSDRNEPLSISTPGTSAEGTRDIYLGGEELESITAVAELSTSADGSPVQSVAAAWTSTHMYMLLGEPGETTETDVLGSLQINRLNIEAGCVSQATVTRTPYGTFWAGADDVWFMPYGSLPIRVGTSIRPFLEDQPAGLLWKLHAEYYDGFYRLSLFSSGQGPTLFDPCGMQMWLDLRKGAPRNAAEAVWFGPQEFVQTDAPTYGGGLGGPAGVWCMARDTRATGDNRLYALQSYVIYGGDLPPINGMSLCGFDTVEGRDTCAPQATRTIWEAGYAYAEGDIMVPTPYNGTTAPVLRAPIYIATTGGTSGVSEPDWTAANAVGTLTDGTVTWRLRYWDGTYPMNAYAVPLTQGDNAVELSMLSKEFMLGEPMKEKLLDGAELGYWASDRTQVTYNSHPKQDERSRILGLASEQTADNTANQTTGDRVWQRKLLTPDPTKRFHGLSATWELRQDAGIVITEGVNDTIVMNGMNITIAAGYYADLAAVAQAICTAYFFVANAGLTSTIAQDSGYGRALVGFKVVGLGGEYLEIAAGRLANLFGFTATAGAFEPDYAFGQESPRAKFAPDIQFSGLNLRFKTFNRGPT